MKIGISVIALAMVSGAAVAQPTFLAVKGNQLFRVDSNGVSQFTLSDEMHSLSTISGNKIVGISSTSTGGFTEAYELTGALGPTPTLTLVNSALTQRYPTISDINGTVYGTRDVDNLVTLDNLLSETSVIGQLGLPQGIGGSGYDPVSDTLYLTDFATDSFYKVNYTNATATLVGSLGLDFTNQGGEFFNGRYWAALEDKDNDRFVLGTVNVNTGAFTPEVTLFSGLANLPGTVGLAVIPTPGATVVLGLGVLAAFRRRR